MKIAYLTMAYDLEKMYSMAIPNCDDQKHNHNKVLYLMYQRPFPVHIGDNHDLGIEIREFNIECEGFGWWLMKLKKFLEVCQEEYFIWWDEDDYRQHSYAYDLLCALDPAELAWNLENCEVKLGSLRYRKYTGMGTLGGYVDALRAPVTELLAKYPDGRLRVKAGTREPCDASYAGQWNYVGGALDAHLKKMLVKRYDIAEHSGVRYMTYHSKTNTKGGRDPKENVDYVAI